MKKWFSGIRVKLLMVTAFSVVSILIVGVISFITISSLGERLEVAYNVRAKLAESTGRIDKGINASTRWIWASAAADDNSKDRKDFNNFVRREMEEVRQGIKTYGSLPKAHESTVILEEKIIPSWLLAEKAFDDMVSALEKNDPIQTSRVGQFSRATL